MSVSGVSSSYTYNPFVSRPTSSTESAPKEIPHRVDMASIAHLNSPAMPAPADFMQKLLEAQFTRPVGPPDNAPSELYAEIKVGGKTIAKVYNSGCCERPNNSGGVQLGGPDEEGLTGPALAHFRAEKIAKACGGTIEKADTAVTQAAYNARPPRQFYVDYEAMNAEMERLRRSAEERRGGYRGAPAGPTPGHSTSTTV
jgi:hypothetical protein